MPEITPGDSISYLTVYNAHNGESFKIPKPVRFHAFKSLKEFIAESFEIEEVDQVFLLTSFGIRLDFNLVNELQDVFVFDKRLFIDEYDTDAILARHLGETKALPTQIQSVSLLPDNNVSSITQNLRQIQDWSHRIKREVNGYDEQIKILQREISVIFRSLNIIFQFGSNFVSGNEKNFNNFFNYIKLLNMKTLHRDWKSHYNRLKKFSSIQISNHTFVLSDFLEEGKLHESASFIQAHLPVIIKVFNEMGNSINAVNDKKIGIDKQIEDMRNVSIKLAESILLKDTISSINSTIQNIDRDIDNLSSNYSMNSEDILAIQKTHVNYSVVSLQNSYKLVFDFLAKCRQLKLQLSRESLSIFSGIAQLQLNMVEVRNKLRLVSEPPASNTEIPMNHTTVLTKSNEDEGSFSYTTLNKIKKYEDYLSLCIDLPLLFGFLLIEKRRQFEWYDFYSKGVVSNASEQLSHIIDREKKFRKLWLKKVGHFLTFLIEYPLNTQTPNIDVTLVANHETTQFSILENIQVDREDILAYIQLLKNGNIASTNFVSLLEKNYKDLLRSTVHMKKLTKIILSLSSVDENSNEESINSQDSESDQNLVKGLKTRIKKLENLLHQQQYKNISNWPVTRNSPGVDTRFSMIIDQPLLGAVAQPSASQNSSLLPRNVSTNPTKFLQTRKDSRPLDTVSGSTVGLDTSVIDKHIDNIRLRKEVKEVNEVLDNLKQAKSEQERLIEELRADLKSQKDKLVSREQELATVKKQLEDQRYVSKLDEKELENMKQKLRNRDERISSLESDLRAQRVAIDSSNAENKTLKDSITKIESNNAHLTSMNSDLMSNLSAKDTEMAKERNQMKEDFSSLQGRLDEMTEDYENLMELTAARHKTDDMTINNLQQLIIAIFTYSTELADTLFDYFFEMCLVLESMGLLLSKEEDLFKISRVKGLRSKHGKNAGKDDDSDVISDTPTTHVVKEIESLLAWRFEIAENLKKIEDSQAETETPVSTSTYDDSKLQDKSMELFKVFGQTFAEGDETAVSKLFLKAISFKDHVYIHDDNSHKRFFLNAIAKRFRDVESFAKKQTKENKQRVQEVSEMTARLRTKVTMKNFQVADLVLFLPTRIDGSDTTTLAVQPWAAFNIDAPHYFLDISDATKLQNRDWMVGRINKISSHHVTKENMENKDENPFHLGVGTNWYTIHASEETEGK
ncbi:oligomeric, coiled-coil, peripheral membrane protein [Scheffersomyces spartinae]|uniref:Autophagy-related protein 11 n=1 Tax=Scheffersomyces spartinae TaxID=45513 RepID=A0A9P7V9H1_9ASCO|nr:oligomeric, coiled-coil, peripheral membrane protein [Scheffersomyces spartinae]KAG7193313.1 oligomeric, coiled-coil, peripheral membrane protein [Scheffersomyces spartinae]